MGTDCKSAAFSFGGSNPPAPTKNSGIQWVPEFLFYLPCKRGCKGGFEQHRPAEQSGGEKSPSGAFLDARLATSTRAHQELRYPMGTGVSVLSALKKGMQGWIRTAAEPTAACGGNREARLGQRSAFSKPCQGAAEKAASATRKTRRIVRRGKKPLCNSDDRCQRQKQGGAVGAAASRMRVPPKARCSRWEPRPGLLVLRGSRRPPAPTKKPQRIKIRCGFCLVVLFSLCLPIRAAVPECCFEQ